MYLTRLLQPRNECVLVCSATICTVCTAEQTMPRCGPAGLHRVAAHWRLGLTACGLMAAQAKT